MLLYVCIICICKLLSAVSNLHSLFLPYNSCNLTINTVLINRAVSIARTYKDIYVFLDYWEDNVGLKETPEKLFVHGNKDVVWWIKEQSLHIYDKNALLDGTELGDSLINASQRLLSTTYPHIHGFQSTLLSQNLGFNSINGPSVQIHHTG